MNYTIYNPYDDNSKDIHIISNDLIYSEVCGMSGCQVNNQENHDLIHSKCRQIADLIREINELNK